MRWSRAARHVVFALAFVVGLAPGARAQQTVNTASVAGRVTDPTGAPVDGAPVTARNTDTNVTAETTTDAGGRFRFAYLQVGPYTITVASPGFAPLSRTLTLGAGAAFDLPLTLALPALSTSVTVSAAPEVLESARSQIATTVPRTEIDALPMNGRNFLDLALLAPGVSPTNVGGGTQIFPETSAVPGVGVSVNSQRNLSNNFIVDGLSANDDAAALSSVAYSVDAIDEFQVVSGGGQAELGRALGGDVNVVTRSGTNTFEGDAYGFFRDDRLNAANALLGATLPMHQNQFGTSVGGPIRRNRTFFFGNIEERRLSETGLVTIPAETASTIDAALAAVGYPGPGVATGVYPDPIDSTMALAKVDHQVSASDQVSVRYSAYGASSLNARGAGGTSAPSSSANLDDLDQSIAVGNVRTIASRVVLETRAQFADGHLTAPPSDPVGPAVSISGVATFGTLSISPTARVNRTVEFVNNLTYQMGAHALRAGADVLDNDTTITFPRADRGSYSFPSLASFLAGAYNNAGFTQTFGPSVVALSNPNVGLYVQDEWAAGSRLTINAGLRYDLQFLQTIDTDTNNLSPRLGVVWVPGHARRTVVRASGGRYFDRLPLRALANAILSADNTTDLSRLQQISVTLSPGQTLAPVFPGILSQQVASTTLVNFTTMDPHIQDAYSNQASVEIERELGRTASIAIGYDHVGGHDLVMQINENAPTCVVAGSNNGCRPNVAYANDSQYSSVGSSVYDGLHVSLVQRPARWGSYRVSYTLSKAMDDVGEAFFNGPIDNANVMEDWGRSDDDQRHRVVATGTINTPATPGATSWQRFTHGFELTGMVQWYSALPFNITTGANTVQATAARPTVDGAFIPRNSGTGSDFSSVNVRLTRRLPLGAHSRLDLMVEAFNVFNRANALARVTTFGTGVYPSSPAPNFGQVIVVGDPRTVQLGVRVSY